MSMTRWLAWGLAFPAVTAAAGAVAQTAVNAPPVRETVDANGVDLIRGAFNMSVTDVSIGPAGSHGLAYTRSWEGNGWRDNLSSGISGSTQSPVVTVGDASDSFTLSGTVYTADQGNGATLVQQGGTGSGGDYVYTSSNGAVARFGVFDNVNFATTPRAVANIAIIKSITYPDGASTQFNYLIKSYTVYDPQGRPSRTVYVARMSSVTNNFGYKLLLQYQSETLSQDSQPYDGWAVLNKVVAINTKTAGCDPNATSCSSIGAWPSAAYDAYSPNQVTDAAGRTTRYTYNGDGRITGIRRPGAATDDLTIGYDSNYRVHTIAKVGQTWTYDYSADSAGATITVKTTNPDGTYRSLVSSTVNAEPKSTTDELNKTTTYGYYSPSSSLLTLVTYPGTNSTSYGYDGRGNVTSTTWHAKPSLGGPDIATTATYPSSCANAKTCNQPTWTKDAKGNQTDYTYDGTHGGVTSITQPAGANGVRPAIQIAYTGFADGSGGTIYLPTSTTTCQTQGSCSGTSDQIVVSTNYGSVSNNLLPQSMTRRAGDSSVSASTSMSYDAIGNVVSTTDPVNATTQLRYNADRQVVETISADPDGSGTLKARAVRTGYNTDGTVSSVESGTDTGTFQSLQQVNASYDGYGRKVRDTLTAGGTTYGVTDYAFDVNGRPSCTAVRMNPGTWSGQPGACSLTGAGSDGPDRITRIGYDAVGRPKTQTLGVGTSTPITETTLYYSANGKVVAADDARGNDTAYSLDGYDRSYATTYPDNSYEQLTLDANGNATQRRLRDGKVLTYTYDARNLRTHDHNLNSGVSEEVDVDYSYDLLGRLTRAQDANGWYKAYEYDALGRVTREYSNVGDNRFGYDAAGRRTRQTWSDGFYVTYDYDTLGEMTAIHENGTGGTLASFGYDDLGERTSLLRGNGTVTRWGYDAVSRLQSLTQDLVGTASDLSVTYGYNAASQIRTRTGSNAAYAWGGAVNVDRAYSTNNLNQYTSAGSTNFGYDGRGNLTTSGSTTFGYDSRNELSRNASGQLLYHNPVGELGQLPGPLNLDWAAGQLATETDGSGAIQRRYVYGPGADEVLVWYEGAGTSTRRWLHADERGSIVAVSDGSGNKLAINSYDDYGIPGPSNLGRFQYTGQYWLAEAGVYDFKARAYSPTLGRFLQTDPIGYADGMGWYTYAHADPVNWSDPSGLNACDDLGRKTVRYGYSYTAPGSYQSPDATKRTPEYVDVGPICGGRLDPLPEPTLGSPIAPLPSHSNGSTPAIITPQNDVVVTAKKYAKRFGQCVAAQYGFGDGSVSAGLDLGKIASEIGGIPLYKPLIGVPVIGNSSKFTNVLSYVPFKLGIRANTGLQILGSGRVFGILGRLNAPVAAALAAYDAVSIGICTAGE